MRLTTSLSAVSLGLLLSQCGVPAEEQDFTTDSVSGPLKVKVIQDQASIDVITDSQSADVISVDAPEELEAAPTPTQPEVVAPPPTANTPQPTGFSSYRIAVSEMKQDCSGDTVGIEGLRMYRAGILLEDSFKNYPNSPLEQYSRGKIGVYDTQVSASGSFDDFYPFEVFGGGFGAGWFSPRDSFTDNESPSPALVSVWVQISFGQQKVVVDSIFLDGGSSDMAGFEACAPSRFQVLGSNDGVAWEVLANAAMDTQQGVTVTLDQSKSIIASAE
ncbi:MAG: hypothetical protein HRU19_20370 [Pseudobacteriovorax sp.]|nr:hypothetical protein [Pseudobacteriovorax sp.]